MTQAHEPWREALVRRSGQAVLLFALLVAPYVLSRATRTVYLAGFAMLALGGAAACWAGLAARVRGSVLVGVLLFAGGVALRGLGLVPGSILCLALASVLASLLFGPRAAALAVLVGALEVALLGAAGRFETSQAGAVEQLQPASWYRMAGTFALLTGLLVVLVSAALRRMEASLALAQESEKRLRLLLDNLPVMVDCVDAAGGVHYWNRECERVTGYSAAEIVGNPRALELLYPDARARERMLAEWRARGKQYRNWAFSLTARDGSVRTIEWSHLSEPEALALWPDWQIGVDVTERNRAEEAVRHNEELFRAVVEDQTEMIVRWKPDGTRTFVNDAYCRVFGRTASELVGTSFLPQVAEPYRETVWQKIRSLTPAAPVATHVHESVTETGERRWQEWTDRAIFDGDGRLVELQSTGRDITDSRRAQEALQRSERMAGIGALVSGVAHEVRTPLFGITANLDAYEQHQDESSERRDVIARLRTQVQRLSELMGDLLDYGRPAPLELLSGGLVEPIREALRSCAPAAARAGVTLAADLEDFSLELMRDPGRLEQVFENLLSNAIQHSRAGATVRVRKAAGDAAPPGSVACLIEDEGPGIPEQDLARVFEPFFSRRRGGTGLGLAIVQRIVDDHGGSVRAANRPTGGAVFTVLLPLREARPGSRPPFAAGPPAGEPPRLPA